jgi:hypothetical protein
VAGVLAVAPTWGLRGAGAVRAVAGEGGLEGGAGLGDASTTRLTGGVVEPPAGCELDEGELVCHAPKSTQGV